MALRRADKLGIAVVVLGLVLVGLSAAEDVPVPVARSLSWGTLAAAVVLAVAAFPLARLKGRAGAAALGSVAGLGFGVVAVATRILPAPLTVSGLLTDPATYALLLSGALALLTYSTALQRGSVTLATAPLVVLETVAPAAVGVLLLGDSPRPGWGWVAAAGFVIAVAGALSLARHGELQPEADTATFNGAGTANSTETGTASFNGAGAASSTETGATSSTETGTASTTETSTASTTETGTVEP
jgi:hypothetical protein